MVLNFARALRASGPQWIPAKSKYAPGGVEVYCQEPWSPELTVFGVWELLKGELIYFFTRSA